MEDGYAPLIAYLEGLRGKAQKGSGPLEVGRVREFGFPYPFPGEDPRSDSEARAQFVIERLRACIATIAEGDPRNGAILRHYFFGEGNQAGRQKAAAKEMGSKESTARNFQSQALARLAAELHVTADAVAQRAADPDEDHDALLKDVVAVLRRAYRSSKLADLAGIVIPDAPPIYDASVTLRLKDEPQDPEAYHLTLSTVTACTHKLHFMALSPRATLSDLIFSTCPQVAEVFTCSRREDLEERAEAWVSDSDTLNAVGTNAQGQVNKTQIPLQRVDRDEHKAVLKELPKKHHKDVVLLKAELPRSPSDPATRLELDLPATMLRNDGYCYWLADRPTYLSTITFDASGFTLRDGERFTLQPCLRATAYEPKPTNKVFKILVDGWVVRGQGALLMWA